MNGNTSRRDVRNFALPIRGLLLLAAVAGSELIRLLPASSDIATPTFRSDWLVAWITGSVLNALVLAWLARSAEVRRVALFVLLLVVFAGVRTVLVAVESAFFGSAIAGIDDALITTTVAGMLAAVLAAGAAAWLFGRPEPAPASDARRASLGRPAPLVMRLLLTGVVYLILFFAFGLAIFQVDAVRTFYADLETHAGLLAIVEIARGTGFGITALVLLVTTYGSRAHHALMTAAAFSVFNATLLLYPVASLPDTVRYWHVVELATENFLFGLIAVRLLRPLVHRHTDAIA